MLNPLLWSSNVMTRTKAITCKAVLETILPCGVEMWTTKTENRRHQKRLRAM